MRSFCLFNLNGIFSVDIQKNPFLRWGGQNSHLNDVQIPLQNASDVVNEDGYHFVNLTEVMNNSSEFRLLVRGHVLDYKGCSGKESNFTYNGELNSLEITFFPFSTKLCSRLVF